MSTAPAVTATGSVLFLSDSWNRRKIAAVALSVAGIVVVNVGGTSGSDALQSNTGFAALLIGSALVFGAVCCEAGYTLLGKVATERLEPMLTVFLASALAVPLFLAAAFAFELGSFAPGGIDATGWLALFFWGAGTLGLGSILWYKGLQRAEGTIAAGFMGVMPVSALVLSYVLLSEPVHASHLIGFGIVFSGVLLISREHALGGEE
jgi:drug/metabolite transporter (DMT)-like permease